jgi:hypothetical protein
MRFLIALLIPLFISGCSKGASERHYEEIVIQAPALNTPTMAEDPHEALGLDIPIMKNHTREDIGLTWDVPTGWKEEPGSGMRMATFHLSDHPDDIDASIVSLGGVAGGVSANLARWAKQINLDVASAEFDQFVNEAPVLKTAAGIEARIFDFTKLQLGENPSAKSMIAAIVELGDETVFVKMTGTIQAVWTNKEAFKELTQSVRKK